MNENADRAERMRARFRELHAASELFVMPNPFDVGSAKLLSSLGFPALATTSSGFAATVGRRDGNATFDELIAHIAALTAVVDVPLNVDSERLFSETLEGLAVNIGRIAAAGAAGCSIEDWNPATGAIDELDVATARVRVAAAAAHEHGLLLTARAEQHLHGSAAIAETIDRLIAFRDAGADVVFAPGLVDLDDIAAVVRETAAPVNVLAFPNGPSVPQLASVGVRRVSTGGALAWAAYGAVVRAAQELRHEGTSSYWSDGLAREVRTSVFD